MAAHHGFHFSRKTLNISFRQDKTNVASTHLRKIDLLPVSVRVGSCITTTFFKSETEFHQILMACFGLYPVCIILDHKWQWIYLFKNEIHNNKLRQKYGPNIWTKISHSTKNVQTAASFTHALKRLN